MLAKPVERWAIPRWGDVVICYGPGTDASMDSPEALEKTIKRWQALKRLEELKRTTK